MVQGIGWQDIFDVLFIVLFDMMHFAVDLHVLVVQFVTSGCFPGWIRDG